MAACGITDRQFEEMFHIHYEAIRNYIFYKSGNIVRNLPLSLSEGFRRRVEALSFYNCILIFEL
jgi:hypothetical protein